MGAALRFLDSEFCGGLLLYSHSCAGVVAASVYVPVCVGVAHRGAREWIQLGHVTTHRISSSSSSGGGSKAAAQLLASADSRDDYWARAHEISNRGADTQN
jgi:hypothetical protein